MCRRGLEPGCLPCNARREAFFALRGDRRTDLVADNGTMRGATALGCAGITAEGRATALRMLLAAGAPIDQQNMFGSTALIRTARHGNVHGTRALLEHGARPDLRTRAVADCDNSECLYDADALQWLALVQDSPERRQCAKLIKAAIRDRRNGQPQRKAARGPSATSHGAEDADSAAELVQWLGGPSLAVLLVVVLFLLRWVRASAAAHNGDGPAATSRGGAHKRLAKKKK